MNHICLYNHFTAVQSLRTVHMLFFHSTVCYELLFPLTRCCSTTLCCCIVLPGRPTRRLHLNRL